MDQNETAYCELEITKVTLLPVKYAESVKKCAGKGAENIWYCLADENTVALVNAGGKAFDWPEGCDYLWSGVRPMLEFSSGDEDSFKTGNRFRMAGHTFTVISDGMALCDELIFHKALTLTEVKAATLTADSQDITPDEKEKFEMFRKNPQDNPCTIEGIKNILDQWVEKNSINTLTGNCINTVEKVYDKKE